jgi:hypothetical protein
MNKTIVVSGREFHIVQENADQFDLVAYAPDGEGTHYVVAKQHCYVGRDGRMHSDQFRLGD